ncbi:MAG: helix-turn-helix transcriptional regulator [Bacteroidales bacterium]
MHNLLCISIYGKLNPMPRNPLTDQNRKRLEYLSIFLRELRINSNLTQKELSQNLNIHRNSIIRAENNHNITLLTLFELADSLNISLRELFQDID